MVERHGLALACAALSCASPAGAPAQGFAPPQCYHVVIGGWTGQLEPRLPPAGDVRLYLRLDSARLSGLGPADPGYPVFRARAVSDSGVVDREFQFWRPVAGDSLEVTYLLRMAGIELKLRRSAGDLHGRAIAFTDAVPLSGPAELSTPVVAKRVACSAAPAALLR